MLGIFCTAIEARHTVSQQQIATANALLTQAEKMSDSAWDMVTRLRQYQNRRCADIDEDLQRAGTLNAYFRSIGTLQGSEITCSSAYGLQHDTLAGMMMQPPPVTGKAVEPVDPRHLRRTGSPGGDFRASPAGQQRFLGGD